MRILAGISVAVVAATIGSQAAAQSMAGITYESSAVALAFNFHDDGEDDPYLENYTTQFSAASRDSFGGGFGATFTPRYNKEQYSDSFYSERYLLDLNPTYDLGMGSVGLYYTALAYNDGDDEDHAAYGATARLKSGAIGFDGYAGLYTEEGEFMADTYGADVSYDISEAASVYFAYQRDVYFGGDDFSAVSTIGGSYSLSGLTGMPITITGEVTGFTFDGVSLSDSEWNRFSIMASNDFGAGANSIFRGFRA